VTALVAISVITVAGLAIAGFGPQFVAMMRRRPRRFDPVPPRYDPGRERRAERRARELLRSVVSAEEYEMYAELGFLSVEGAAGDGGYAYLLYPHRPILAYDTRTGELLNEYCVGFPDHSEATPGHRLPDSDDVLAKWMSLHGGERALIEAANMHVPGWQVDPGQVRRDLRRLHLWRAARARVAA
jgi:hypothetical protein